METKSRLKVTAGRDPGLPPSASSVERATPPRLPLPWHLHTALGTGQISNPSPECHGMLHERTEPRHSHSPPSHSPEMWTRLEGCLGFLVSGTSYVLLRLFHILYTTAVVADEN